MQKDAVEVRGAPGAPPAILEGRIEEDSFHRVAIRVAGGSLKVVPRGEVLRVAFSGPPELVRGLASYGAGELPRAAEELAVAATTAPRLPRQEALWRLASCRFAERKPDVAAGLLARLQASEPEGRFAVEIPLALGKEALAGGDAEAARGHFERARVKALELSADPADAARCQVWIARALAELGRLDAARSAYAGAARRRGLTDSGPSPDAVTVEAARLLLLEGRAEEAADAFGAALAQVGPGDRDAFATAALGLSEVHLAAGRHEDALLAAARVFAPEAFRRDPVLAEAVGLALYRGALALEAAALALTARTDLELRGERLHHRRRLLTEARLRFPDTLGGRLAREASHRRP